MSSIMESVCFEVASVCFSNKVWNCVNWELTRDSNLLTTVSTLVETMVDEDEAGGAVAGEGLGVTGLGDAGETDLSVGRGGKASESSKTKRTAPVQAGREEVGCEGRWRERKARLQAV